MAVASQTTAGGGIAFLVSAGIVYEIIAAACSSPQTTEINAGKRAGTLMKWVYIGIGQAAVFVAVAAWIDKPHRKEIIAGGVTAGALMYAQYAHAKQAGLANTGAGTVYLLTTTNLATPFSAWTPVWTNQLSASSSFNSSNLRLQCSVSIRAICNFSSNCAIDSHISISACSSFSSDCICISLDCSIQQLFTTNNSSNKRFHRFSHGECVGSCLTCFRSHSLNYR